MRTRVIPAGKSLMMCKPMVDQMKRRQSRNLHLETIPEALPHGEIIAEPISAVQGKAWGAACYRGPKQPPMIRKMHRYRFTVYAVDTMLTIGPECGHKELTKALKGHVIEKADLYGEYTPSGV